LISISPQKEKLGTGGSLIPNSLIKTGSTVINQIKYPPNTGPLIRVICTVVEITFWGYKKKKIIPVIRQPRMCQVEVQQWAECGYIHPWIDLLSMCVCFTVLYHSTFAISATNC